MERLSASIPYAVRHMLMSTFFFALMNVCIKQVGHIPEMEIVFVRCFVSMLLCFAVLWREGVDWKGSNRKLLLARGFFGTMALYTFFITLHKMPLGTAVTIQYISPVFTTIIAVFFLKEKVKPLQWLFFLLSFAGVLVIKGFDNRIALTTLLIGLTSALFSGFAYNMVRRLKEKEHYMVVVLHFQLLGVVAGGIACLFTWQTPSGRDWFYLIAIGVLTQLGQVNLTKALQGDKVANVSILNYLGVLYALLFGALLFGEHYTMLTFGGIALVLAGVLLNYFYTARHAKVVAEEELTTVEE